MRSRRQEPDAAAGQTGSLRRRIYRLSDRLELPWTSSSRERARCSKRCACTRSVVRKFTFTCRSLITRASSAKVWARRAILRSGCFLTERSSGERMNSLIEGGISITSFDGMLPSFNVAPNVDCSSAIWYIVNSARDNNSLLSSDILFFDGDRSQNGHISISATSKGSSTCIATASVRWLVKCLRILVRRLSQVLPT